MDAQDHRSARDLSQHRDIYSTLTGTPLFQRLGTASHLNVFPLTLNLNLMVIHIHGTASLCMLLSQSKARTCCHEGDTANTASTCASDFDYQTIRLTETLWWGHVHPGLWVFSSVRTSHFVIKYVRYSPADPLPLPRLTIAFPNLPEHRISTLDVRERIDMQSLQSCRTPHTMTPCRRALIAQ